MGILQAYRTWLGFYKGFCKLCGWDNAGVVAAANHYAQVLGMVVLLLSFPKAKESHLGAESSTCFPQGAPGRPPSSARRSGRWASKVRADDPLC